jgi:N6-adenosine-specific RNA methylase IME4
MDREDAEEFTQAIGQVVGGGWRLIALGIKQGVPNALGLDNREWVEQRLGGYVRLSLSDRREAVAELTQEGLSTRKIGDVLGVSKDTVRGDLDGDKSPNELGLYEQIDAPNGENSPSISKPEPIVIEPPKGTYRCIVIDPPWPMEKIEREVRPNQGQELDYPIMTIPQIRELPIHGLAEREGCHVYLWVTHRFLPDGLRLFDAWNVRYQCLMTWRKNVGITPYSWMYDTEHVLFGRIGGLSLNEQGLRLSFDAPVTRHSEKPQVFYDRVRQASPEPRLDMFAREYREGFTVWGNEV